MAYSRSAKRSYKRKYPRSRSTKYLKKRRLMRKSRRYKKAKHVNVSAPLAVTPTTYFSGAKPKGAAILEKRYKANTRNLSFKNDYGFWYNDVAYAQSVQDQIMLDKSALQNIQTKVRNEYTTFGAAQNLANRFYLQYMVREYKIMNATTSPVSLDLYHYVCRRDCNSTVYDLWIAGTQNEGQPSGTINADLVQFDTPRVMGMKPFVSDAVGRFWKLKKTTSIILAVGQMVQHKIKLPVYKTINGSVLNNGSTYLAGVSHDMLAVLQGCPAELTVVANSATNQTVQKYAEVRYTMTQTMCYKFSEDADVDLAVTFNSVVSTNTTKVNDITGAVDNVQIGPQ